MKFQQAPILDIQIRKIKKYSDERGWLSELYRTDESELYPAMCYISITKPNITRGPHEHIEQTDWFCFFSSTFLVVLWDNRPNSLTFKNTMRLVVGEDDPSIIIVPQGIVHGYKNIGDKDGLVINLPNRLFAGKNKKQNIDEIRHEVDANSPFIIA